MSAASPARPAEPSGAPFVVGIDLGTTNCAVAYVDTRGQGDAPAPVLDLPLLQLVGAGLVEARPTLPSSLYLPGEHEVSPEATALPFERPHPRTLVGVHALELGAKVPERLIASSKSWLSHGGVDRRGPILPWGSDPAEVDKISPLEAARRLLGHVRAVWDHQVARGELALALERQQVLLTVPASFDPVARELTLEAAREAGLPQVTLLEEPQAAFYAWLERAGDGWRRALRVGDLVLVFDVGGGTTDLTLIAVREEEGSLVLERVAVGEHLLLGGDNMDLALAHIAARRLSGKGELDPWQSRALWLAARRAKEALLAEPGREQAEVVVLGRGSKLIGATRKAQLTQEDIQQVVLQGFFPACPADERPVRRRGAGLSELGLPFEPDPAITKHLAAFLARHGDAAGGHHGPRGAARPTAVLFNGGVFKGPALRAAALAALSAWSPDVAVKALEGEHLDLAVARGAAYYGLVRRGRGVRIRGGIARTYYVGIESSLPAVPGLQAPLKGLCVAPFGTEEGTALPASEREFALLVGEPADFRVLASTQRKEDPPGLLLERIAPDEVHELAPLRVTLPPAPGEAPGATVPVRLQAAVTEVGTLEVHCVARDGRRFKLEWNIREQEGA